MISTGCITQYLPESISDQEYFVVEGLLTDQLERPVIKVSRSVPLGSKATINPVGRCTVWISDGANKFTFNESAPGIYVSSMSIRGEAGKKYTLNIEIVHYEKPNLRVVDYFLKSSPAELIPVPEIDSIYYEKVELRQEDGFSIPGEGCRVFLNTSSGSGTCKFYRWDYMETWMIENPGYPGAINRVCWVTKNSQEINVKNTSVLSENRIDRLPVKFISNESDRLLSRYRIEVNQYSISEDEFNFWSNLKDINEQSINLYDMIPSAISGNISCINNPGLPILGYFSVSARRSKSIYIDEPLKGQVNPYKDCLQDTLFKQKEDVIFPPPLFWEFVGKYYWVVYLTDNYVITTRNKECVDCTARGTTEKPSYWSEGKSNIR